MNLGFRVRSGGQATDVRVDQKTLSEPPKRQNVTAYRRDVCVGLAAILTGCAGRGEGGMQNTETERPSSTSEGADYATCDTESNRGPESAAKIPDPLSEARVATYVETVERDVVLPAEERISDGYVVVGAVEVEAVTHGYVARVPVNGGYYNEPAAGDATETVHYDLPMHTARYFVNERVVRRTEAVDEPADPREFGRVLVCNPA
jgi:hypothetical protein